MYLEVAGPESEIESALRTLPGISRVTTTTGGDGFVAVEVDSERGRDIRRELAATVVGRGWGLLELRPMRKSLEDVFLSLTTEDATGAAAEAPVPIDEPQPDEEAANA
jgi:ABC-2 type transport system ATP-binding protein